jgi:hypothetical protein
VTFLRRQPAFPGVGSCDRGVSGRPPGGAGLAQMEGMSLEVVLGRALAAFAHPLLAWRMLSPRGRVGLAGAYMAAGYVTVLTALLLVGH